jgi:hypothetical protein
MGYSVKMGGAGVMSATDKNRLTTVYHYVNDGFAHNNYTVESMIFSRPDALTEMDLDYMISNRMFWKVFIACKVNIYNNALDDATESHVQPWYILDRGHDFTGETFDLLYYGVRSHAGKSGTDYYKSAMRAWLNGACYDAFDSTIKPLMLPMIVESFWGYFYDYVKAPSMTEYGNTAHYQNDSGNVRGRCYQEGNPYPFWPSCTTFENVKTASNTNYTTSASYYIFSRTRNEANTKQVWTLNAKDNSMVRNDSVAPSNIYFYQPIIRVGNFPYINKFAI